MLTAIAAASVLLQTTPTPVPVQTRYVDPGVVGPGFIGFIMFVGLGLTTFLLWRSMNRQLKRIDFDEGPESGKSAAPKPFTRVGPVPPRADDSDRRAGSPGGR